MGGNKKTKVIAGITAAAALMLAGCGLLYQKSGESSSALTRYETTAPGDQSLNDGKNGTESQTTDDGNTVGDGNDTVGGNSSGDGNTTVRENSSGDGNATVRENSSGYGNASAGVQAEKAPEGTGFFQVAGSKIYNGNGETVVIKGMALSNNVWDNPKTPVYTNHDEESYRELAQLGFNSVRFYLNYGLFEDNDAPFQYKQEAFEWLDQNVEWAEKYGISIIFNMHVPQGGFLQVGHCALFAEKQYMDRHKALWMEIASRYADEPAVMGYGLVNEPFLPDQGEMQKTLDVYYSYINELVKEIRTVDDKHIIFVETPYGYGSNGSNTYFTLDESFRRIEDKNTVYEFHYYEPYKYISQSFSYVTSDKNWIYDDNTIALLRGSRDIVTEYGNDKSNGSPVLSGDWQYVESDFTPTQTGEVNFGNFLIYLFGMGKNSTAWIDDVSVKEYDSEGNYIREVYQYHFPKSTYVGSDLQTGGGVLEYDEKEGHDEAGSIKISGAADTFRAIRGYDVGHDYFKVQEGKCYKASAYVKLKNAESGAVVSPALQMGKADKVYSLGKEYLQTALDPFLNISEKYNVPVYIGEFGIGSKMIDSELKGEKWVSDVLDIFNAAQVSYNYHDYHQLNCGLYDNAATEKRTTYVEGLWKIFLEKIRGR